MNRTKFLKGECQHCAGHVEFPAEMAGLPVECPHCGQQTELLLARPPEESGLPKGPMIWAIIGIVILCLGLVGALVALKRAEKWAARQKQRADPPLASTTETSPQPESAAADDSSQPQQGFVLSAVQLEKSVGTSLVYAVGTVKNQTDRKRFGVKVELDIFDAAEQKLATATDYQPVIEPGASWRFKALVLDSKAISAKLSAIKEDQ